MRHTPLTPQSGDGKISAKEFRRALAALGVRAKRAEVDNLFHTFDPDRSGEIDFGEMHSLLRAVQRDQEERARALTVEATEPEKLLALVSDVAGTPQTSWRGAGSQIVLGTLMKDETKPIDLLRLELLGKGATIMQLFRSWDHDCDGKARVPSSPRPITSLPGPPPPLPPPPPPPPAQIGRAHR